MALGDQICTLQGVYAYYTYCVSEKYIIPSPLLVNILSLSGFFNFLKLEDPLFVGFLISQNEVQFFSNS